nr:MAG TPA: hypothetical protein [Inoviridae sp.]
MQYITKLRTFFYMIILYLSAIIHTTAKAGGIQNV